MQTARIVTDSFVAKLVNLALHGLQPLYDPRLKLFAYQVRDGRRILMPPAWSLTYTTITLIGLLRARHHGCREFPIDEAETLRSVAHRSDRFARMGDLGLTLWADALCGGPHQKFLLGEIRRQAQGGALTQITTMELAWLLTGLCYTYRYAGAREGVEKLPWLFNEAITSNFNSETGLFSHRRGGGWSKVVRSQIGNFADQIYAVYALSAFCEVFDDSTALQVALQCARRLCDLQGPQGQWWWHYHARQGVVVSRYPVFSVHQDGMGPMALFKLSRVSGHDFSPAVERGLAWLLGNNELGIEIIDWGRHIIWRDIERTRPAALARYISMVLAGLGLPHVASLVDSGSHYRVNREMRPYHLGWLLYAFAGEHPLLSVLEGRRDNESE